MYPILYIDAIRIKIRDGGAVANKATHVVIGVDVDGIKQVLGIWIQQTEDAKFRHGVLTELRNHLRNTKVQKWIGPPPVGS